MSVPTDPGTTELTLSPERYLPPKDYVTQEAIVSRCQGRRLGPAPNDAYCPRCLERRFPSHPFWKLCNHACGVCQTNQHVGDLCPRIYATARWWKKHYNIRFFPSYSRSRPTPEQQAKLAQLNFRVDADAMGDDRPPPSGYNPGAAGFVIKREASAEEDLGGFSTDGNPGCVQELEKEKMSLMKRRVQDMVRIQELEQPT